MDQNVPSHTVPAGSTSAEVLLLQSGTLAFGCRTTARILAAQNGRHTHFQHRIQGLKAETRVAPQQPHSLGVIGQIRDKACSTSCSKGSSDSKQAVDEPPGSVRLGRGSRVDHRVRVMSSLQRVASPHTGRHFYYRRLGRANFTPLYRNPDFFSIIRRLLDSRFCIVHVVSGPSYQL